MAPPHLTPWSPDLQTYHRMAELGVFGDERVELLDGVLHAMSPKGREHEQALSFLTRRAVLAVDENYEVRIQLALSLSERSVPEPDLAIAGWDIERPYHPVTANLVCEVAASSLKTDRTTKLAIYARYAIPEYWVVDVNLDGLTLEQHTEPAGETYARTRVLRSGTVRATQVPFALALDDLWAATTRRPLASQAVQTPVPAGTHEAGGSGATSSS